MMVRVRFFAIRRHIINQRVTDVDIIYVHETRVVRNFVFDVRKDKDLESSLQFAQQQFVEEVQRKGYNALWSEGCVKHVLAALLSSAYNSV
jgi:hypothetical protein